MRVSDVSSNNVCDSVLFMCMNQTEKGQVCHTRAWVPIFHIPNHEARVARVNFSFGNGIGETQVMRRTKYL